MHAKSASVATCRARWSARALYGRIRRLNLHEKRLEGAKTAAIRHQQRPARTVFQARTSMRGLAGAGRAFSGDAYGAILSIKMAA